MSKRNRKKWQEERATKGRPKKRIFNKNLVVLKDIADLTTNLQSIGGQANPVVKVPVHCPLLTRSLPCRDSIQVSQ